MSHLIAVPVLAAALACGPSQLSRREAENDIRKDYPVVVSVRVPETASAIKGSPEHAKLVGLQEALARTGWFTVARAPEGDREKFQFKDRKGANIADDEYVWVLGCNLCIRRVLEIYEKLPRAQQLEGDVVKVHHGAKQHLDLTMMYGSMVYRYGRRDFHDVHGLPPVRALNAPLAIAQPVTIGSWTDHCPACGAANPDGFRFCRKCGASMRG